MTARAWSRTPGRAATSRPHASEPRHHLIDRPPGGIRPAAFCVLTLEFTTKPTFGGNRMPTYMDMHELPGVKAADVVGAHEADLKVQGKYGVNYKHYWVDEAAGKVFCLVDAPDRETASKVHQEAHGLVAEQLFEVEQGA